MVTGFGLRIDLGALLTALRPSKGEGKTKIFTSEESVPLVLKDLRACQCGKGRDDAKSEWSKMAEKDCPATGVTGPGRPLPLCPPQGAPRNRAQRHPGFNAPTMTRWRWCQRAGFCCGGSSAASDAIERCG